MFDEIMNSFGFRISQIKVTNFKNFKKLDLELDNFNVIIGENASGKSNLIQVFTFLNDIYKQGLADAIAYQGGNNLLCNFSAKKKELEFEIHFISNSPHLLYRLHPHHNYKNKVTTQHMIYRFSINVNNSSTFKIIKDELEIFCSYDVEDRISKKKKEGEGKVWFSRGDPVKIKKSFPDSAGSIIQEHYDFFKFSPITKSQLLFESDALGHIIEGWSDFLKGIGIYDFDPKMIKRSISRRAPAKLSENGGNVASILNELTKDKKKIEMFQLLMQSCLKLYKEFKVERFSDGSLYFQIEESDHITKIPANFVSDGTANLMTMFIALYLQDNQLTILEEPERNIHPGLLLKLISYMKDASIRNQIIITTHNPEILDYVDLSNIFLVIRKKGHSIIMKPNDHKTIQKFKEDMKMSDMLIKNFLNSNE